jgi:hypothetical protein
VPFEIDGSSYYEKSNRVQKDHTHIHYTFNAK